MSAARVGSDRRARLGRARLYLVVDADGAERVLPAALDAGVEIAQLRDPKAQKADLVAAGERMRAECARRGTLFFVNDYADLALSLDADGVHVGQEDEPVASVRERAGDDLLIGLSTHSPEQFDAGLDSPADYLSAGPVHATPTKPGRPATGLGLIEHAAAHATKPFFAIGGIDSETIGAVLAAGAERVVVVRAIRDAPDPSAASAELRAALETPVGAQ